MYHNDMRDNNNNCLRANALLQRVVNYPANTRISRTTPQGKQLELMQIRRFPFELRVYIYGITQSVRSGGDCRFETFLHNRRCRVFPCSRDRHLQVRERRVKLEPVRNRFFLKKNRNANVRKLIKKRLKHTINNRWKPQYRLAVIRILCIFEFGRSGFIRTQCVSISISNQTFPLD